MVRLNRTHSFPHFKFTSKIFQIYALYFGKNSSESSRIRSIRPHTPRMMQNSHHLFTHYILCFRCLTIGRELSEIPANQAKFASFTHKFWEICTKIHLQPSSLFSEQSTENSRKLEQINQISRSSPTAPTNCAKFAQSATTHQLSRSESRELQKYTANDVSSAPFTQRISKSHEIRDICKQNTR